MLCSRLGKSEKSCSLLWSVYNLAYLFYKVLRTQLYILYCPCSSNTVSQESWFYKLLTSWDGTLLISQQPHTASCPSFPAALLWTLVNPAAAGGPQALSQTKCTEKGDTGESWCVGRLERLPEWVSGVKTLLVGTSTSFLLSFGDSLPSWCCLESLLGTHTWRVKLDQLELKVAPVRLQGDADLSPSLSWVPCSFCREKKKNVEAKLFQRAGQTPCVC